MRLSDIFPEIVRIRVAREQTRIRETLEILNRVEAQAGSLLAAYVWFCSKPMAGFGGMTPDQLVREGKTSHIHAYLDRIEAGGYA